MTGDTHDPALDAARSTLRAEQDRVISAQPNVLTSDPVTDRALELFGELTRTVPDADSDRVRRGAFTYDPELESERIARGKALIHRVEPGPREDPNYFAILAYQAASVEMAYQEIVAGKGDDQFLRFLLGTAHAPDVNAFAQRTSSDGYTIVVLYSGLVDFIYQAAKVVVEALDPKRVTEGRGLVRASADLDEIRVKLDQDPGPAERLYATLEAYFYHGYPRADADETVPDVQHPPLSLIVGQAERWVIGHEYGHGLWHAPATVAAAVNISRAEEFFADSNATVATVLSAAKLDVVPPEFPLGGAIFALRCLDLLQRGVSIVRTGSETSLGESPTHPAARERADAVINTFRQFFDVEYGDVGFDLWFRPRLEAPETHNFKGERINQAYAYANVLQAVWKPVRNRLLDDHRDQRPLHPIWRQ